MPNYTTKLNLEKPLGNEFYNVITVQNVNSDKIDANVIDTEIKNNCMAGGGIKGYIEDGTAHVVGEIWLSRSTPGEFECLVANSDNYLDVTPGAEKWLQIDDLTNAGKLQNLIDNNGDIQGKILFRNYSWSSPAGDYSQILIDIGVTYKKILSHSMSWTNGKFPLHFETQNGQIQLGYNAGTDGYWINKQNTGSGYVCLTLLV